MDITALDLDALRKLADAITEVLDSRLHRRVHMGEEILVKGSLSRALHLPELRKKLYSHQTSRQQVGKDELIQLWQTLSDNTRQSVLERLHWYEPEKLDWDDPRSNRKPFYDAQQ